MATSEQLIVSRAGGSRWPTYPTTIVRFPCVGATAELRARVFACEHASVGSEEARTPPVFLSRNLTCVRCEKYKGEFLSRTPMSRRARATQVTQR